MEEFLNWLRSMIGLDKEKEGKKDERPHYYINSRKEIEGIASSMEFFAAIFMIIATFFSKQDVVSQRFHYGVAAALIVTSVLFRVICYCNECFAKSMRNQSQGYTECCQESNLEEPEAKKDNVNSTEEESTKNPGENEEKDHGSDDHNKPDNIEEAKESEFIEKKSEIGNSNLTIPQALVVERPKDETNNSREEEKEKVKGSSIARHAFQNGRVEILETRSDQDKREKKEEYSSENLEEELEKLKEKNAKWEQKLKEIDQKLEKLRTKKIKQDKKLKKLTEEHEKDQAKWEQEKQELDTTLYDTQSWFAYYHGLCISYQGKQTVWKQERVAWEQEKNELIAKVQSATATSNLFRGVLHDLGY